MPSTNIKISEEEVIKLVSEFLMNRSLNISMLSLERETGVINGVFSDDLLFLRQLILDGQWDDVIDFIQPLESIESFKLNKFLYVIQRHKYLELLCIKAESGQSMNYELTVDELVKCVNQLEKLCPTKEEYSNLCLLLTLPRLSDNSEYQNWNPSNARVECFKEIYPMIEKFLPLDKRSMKDGNCLSVSQNDRLVQLLIKGLLYESCVEYCQQKATGADIDNDNVKLVSILSGTTINDNDVSLLSWLQAIPFETFSCPFEKKKLTIDVTPLERPSLDASWSEQILVAPIKPRIFPHSAMSNIRSRGSNDILSRSLMPQYDGLSYGLTRAGAERLSYPSDFPGSMSKSFAAPGFHLNVSAKNRMQASVDRLFDDTHVLDTQSSIIIENTPPRSRSPIMSVNSPPTSPNSALENSSPTSIPAALKTSTPMSRDVKRSAGLPQTASPKQSMTTPTVSKTVESRSAENNSRDSSKDSSELYHQYQKQRIKLQEQLEAQERQRQIYQQQLADLDAKPVHDMEDNRLADSPIISRREQKNIDQLIDDGRGDRSSTHEDNGDPDGSLHMSDLNNSPAIQNQVPGTPMHHSPKTPPKVQNSPKPKQVSMC